MSLCDCQLCRLDVYNEQSSFRPILTSVPITIRLIAFLLLFLNTLQIRKPIIQQLVIKEAADLQLRYLKLIYKMKQKSKVGIPFLV